MMETEHEAHLRSVITEAATLINNKYRKGQREHGGLLWKKEGLIDMAIDEAIDQLTYLLSLKKQIQESGVQLGSVTEAETGLVADSLVRGG